MSPDQTHQMVEVGVLRDLLNQKQKLIDMLLGERARIMDALIALVNATHEFRQLWIWLPKPTEVTGAWNDAYYLCQRWQSVMHNHPSAPLPTAQDLPPQPDALGQVK